MKINQQYIIEQYQSSMADKMKDELKARKNNDQKLKMLASEFTSILLKQMFKAMRKSVPESKFIDGGFAEDVFTDMLDGEVSQLGAKQQGFNTLSYQLYQQLKNKE